MTGSRHHLCLFNLRPLLRNPLRPSLTSPLLSQDSIFDSFREVCTSRKTPQDPAKRHHKNRERDVHAFTQITNTHVLKHASPPRGFGMFWLNKHELVYALRWRSAALRNSKTFFFCKNDYGGCAEPRKTFKALKGESFFLLEVSSSTLDIIPWTLFKWTMVCGLKGMAQVGLGCVN